MWTLERGGSLSSLGCAVAALGRIGKTLYGLMVQPVSKPNLRLSITRLLSGISGRVPQLRHDVLDNLGLKLIAVPEQVADEETRNWRSLETDGQRQDSSPSWVICTRRFSF